MQPKFNRLITGTTVLLLCLCFFRAEAGVTDSIPKVRLDSVINLKDSLYKEDSIKKALAKIKDVAPNLKKDSASTCGCVPNQKPEITPEGVILSFLPALLFVWLLLWLMNKGLKDFSLKEAMSENTYPTILVDNPQYTSANLVGLLTKENLDEVIMPTIEKTYLVGASPTTLGTPPPPNPSISRYIAFITSMLTLVVALGVSCFYIYHYIRTGCPPELTGISTLLIALGIGVLPYVFNKLAAAIGKSKGDSI